MSIAMLTAAVLPLIPVTADDRRFDSGRTYVSEAARQLIAASPDATVFCLDRSGNHSICLVRSEWARAVELANAGEGKIGPRPFIPNSDF